MLTPTSSRFGLKVYTANGGNIFAGRKRKPLRIDGKWQGCHTAYSSQNIKMCENGFHAWRTLKAARKCAKYSPGRRIFLVEIFGDIKDAREGDKFCGLFGRSLMEFKPNKVKENGTVYFSPAHMRKQFLKKFPNSAIPFCLTGRDI